MCQHYLSNHIVNVFFFQSQFRFDNECGLGTVVVNKRVSILKQVPDVEFDTL